MAENLMSIGLFEGEKYWRIAVGVDKNLGEEHLKRAILIIEQNLREAFPGAEMPRRLAVRRLFGSKE